MSEHTKGEWRIDAGPRSYSIGIKGTGKIICDMRLPTECGVPIKEIDANAHLIAAAPETKRQRDKLLTACEIVSKRFTEICEGGESIEDFMAAGCMKEIVQAIAESEG